MAEVQLGPTGGSSATQLAAPETPRRRGALAIMGRLIGLVKPLIPVMLLAVLFGVVGYLCAIFLTIVASYELLNLLAAQPAFVSLAAQVPALFKDAGAVFAALVVMGAARGVLHYLEQYCNHYIAFRLLAIIRHKVFAQLRCLCPAKLEGRDKGNLVSIITSDIELLEVFYAHTISPICIAIVVSIVMVVFIGQQSALAAVIALCGYVVIGIVVPVAVGHAGAQPGLVFRNAFGDLNSFVLDSLRGVDETIQYGGGKRRLAEMGRRSDDLAAKQGRLNALAVNQQSVSNLIILLFSLGMLGAMIWQYRTGAIGFVPALISTVAMMGSFGPVLALSNLANNLNQTLACGERVLDLLEEEPLVEEVADGHDVAFDGAVADHVTFGYGDETILDDYVIEIQKGEVVGIHGPSGCGKSTLLKLLMRFWDVQSGTVRVSGQDIRGINTAGLRDVESYVTQDTYLFHDSIANNIGIGRPGATREQIVEAAKKASLDSFVSQLPEGYDTEVGELGDTLSGGERQRIGIARAFLHDAPFLLLDEPTSNLDSLNEGIILKSLKEGAGDRTVVLVSHRLSTLNMCDRVVEMGTDRVS